MNPCLKALQAAFATLWCLALAAVAPLAAPETPYNPTVEAVKSISTMRVKPGDWPQWGGWTGKNNTPAGKNIPMTWDPGRWDEKAGEWIKSSGRNVKWVARLGFETFRSPVIANGKVYIGTSYGAGYVKRFSKRSDLGGLLCLDEQTGHFLWQHANEMLPTGGGHLFPWGGYIDPPLVDGDRLWYVNSRAEVCCLDTEGFRDGENDGPYHDEPNGNPDEADVVWKFDMIARLNVSPHNNTATSVTAAGDRLFVVTGNGVDRSLKIPHPEAPSFLALDRRSGEVLWTDNSPGANILHGQWSSPAYGVLGGVPQVLFAGGDGWLYSFDPAGDNGKSRLLWKFDCNPKEALFAWDAGATRNQILATPVIYDGLVFIAVGEHPDHGNAPGHLWCINPTKRGDVSPQLVFNQRDPTQTVAPRRVQAMDAKQGDFTRDNPNSAAVWHYVGNDLAQRKFEQTMHRTCGTAAIKNGLLFIADFWGLLHCVDVKTGKAHWTHDFLASCWGSPLIVEDHVYIADEEGNVVIFKLSDKKELVAKISMPTAIIYSTPLVANNVLYITTRDRLYAIAAPVGTKD